MPATIKVKTLPVPNLDKLTEAQVSAMEEDNEERIKDKIDDGYEIAGVAGGDNFIMVIFQLAE